MGLSIDIRKHFPGGKDHDQTTHGNWSDGSTAPSSPPSSPPSATVHTLDSLRALGDEWRAAQQQALSDIDNQAAWRNYHDQREVYNESIEDAISMGQITPAEAYEELGYSTAQGTRLEDWKPLPETLYHVTNAATSVRRHGLLDRKAVHAMEGVTGLGGGTSSMISFTDDPEIAAGIHTGMLEAHDFLNGKITVTDIIEQSKTGGDGAYKPFYDSWLGKYDPEAVENLIEGRSIKQIITAGTMEKATTRILEEYPDATDIKPVGTPFGVNKDNWMQFSYVSPTKRFDDHFDAYRTFAMYRESQGGPLDPLFWSPDTKGFAAVPRDEIQSLTFRTKPGTMGVQMSSLAEWRVGTGDAVELVDDLAKHYPGGKDHDQKNHGRRGRGLGISPGDLTNVGEITDDTMIRVKPSSLSIDPKGGEFIQRRPQPAVAPIMKGPLHFTSTPYMMQVGDTLNDKQLAFVEYGKAHPIEAMRRLGEHFDKLGDLADTNIDRNREFLNEAQATEVVMSKIAEVSAVDAYIERGRSILAEIKESSVGDSGIHTYPRVDGSGFVNPIPKSPAEASWGEFVEWASSEHPEHAEALEALTERVEAWKESRGGEQDMMNFRRSVIDASSERGVGDHVERYDIPVGLISVEGTGDRDGLRGVMDSHIKSDRIVRDLSSVGDPPVYNKKTDGYAPLSEFKFFVDGGTVNVGAVVLNEDQVDALVMKGWEVKDAPTGSMYSNPRRIYVARGPDFAQRYGPYGPDAGLPEGTYFTEIRSVQSIELHLARGKSIYELGPLSPRFVTDTKGELDTLATRFRRAKLLGEDIGPLRMKGTISISPRQYTDLLYDEAQRVHTSTKSTLSKIERDYNEIRGTMLQSRSQEQVVIEVLSKHRSMGGQLDLINKRTTDAVRTVNLAAAAYPTDWIERSNKSGQVYVAGKRGARAQYDDVKFDKRTFSFRSEILVDPSHPMADDALHEMGHRFEHVIPELRAAEQAFFRRRTKGDKKVPVPFTRNEKAYPDKFPVLYMGKEYGSPLIRNQQSHKRYTSTEAYELFTTGYPIITGRGKLGMYGSQDLTVYPDSWDEHQAFILGVLATI